jgi:hypothetical protein
MAGGPCTRLQSRLSVFLETTSVVVDEFQLLVLAFAAALQAQMAYCGALPCPDIPHTLLADDLIGRSYWIPGSYTPALSEKHNSFLRLLKNKGFREESMTKFGLYAIDKTTTLESNKSPHG